MSINAIGSVFRKYRTPTAYLVLISLSVLTIYWIRELPNDDPLRDIALSLIAALVVSLTISVVST